MKVVDVIAEILKREGVEFLSCYPTNTLIEAAAAAGIRPIVCRQERVGVGIADGFTRVTNGKRIGVFTMQAGPGAENAFAGITTAYSDSVPVLLLPVGHARDTSQVFHFFRSVQSYAPVTKWAEEITLAKPSAGHHAARIQLFEDGPARSGAGGNSQRRGGGRFSRRGQSTMLPSSVRSAAPTRATLPKRQKSWRKRNPRLSSPGRECSTPKPPMSSSSSPSCCKRR